MTVGYKMWLIFLKADFINEWKANIGFWKEILVINFLERNQKNRKLCHNK